MTPIDYDERVCNLEATIDGMTYEQAQYKEDVKQQLLWLQSQTSTFMSAHRNMKLFNIARMKLNLAPLDDRPLRERYDDTINSSK